MTASSKVPTADRRPHSFTRHGIMVEDPYAWLRDPGYPEVKDKDVLSYLEEENAFFEAAMQPHKALTDRLFEEMKGRIKEDDSSVPQKDGDYIYWRAFEIGAQYRKWYRKPVAAKDDGGEDQLILDEPALAEGMIISAWAPCRSARTAAISPMPSTMMAPNGSRRGSRTCSPAKSCRK